MLPAAGAAPSQLEQDVLEIKNMLKANSEATRNASSISPADLDNLLRSLHCVVVPGEGNVQAAKASFADTTEFKWEANKYEPQQQEQYLEILRSEVSGPSSCT